MVDHLNKGPYDSHQESIYSRPSISVRGRVQENM
jgi:hypothetical protein